MPLVSRLCRVLRQRNQSSSFPSYCSSDHAHALSCAELAACRSNRHAYASAHNSYSFRATLRDGSPAFVRSHLHACGQSSYASGSRAMHGIASSNYLQSGIYRDNTRKIEGCNYQGGSIVRHRFYSGGPAFWTLIGANVAVFLMWHTLDTSFMNKHFLVSIDHVVWRKRYHTLVTSAFSHYRMDHLFRNLIGLYLFGDWIEKMYGGPTLVLLYLCGAVSGSIGHMVYGLKYPILKNIRGYNLRAAPPALGASGTVTTLIMLYGFLSPNNTVKLMLVSMPAELAGAILIGVDVYRGWKGNSRTSVGCHLGGAFFAACLYLTHYFCSGSWTYSWKMS